MTGSTSNLPSVSALPPARPGRDAHSPVPERRQATPAARAPTRSEGAARPALAGTGLVVVLLVGLLVAPLHAWTAGELTVVQWLSAHHAAALDAVTGAIGVLVSPPVGLGLLVVLCAVGARRVGVRRAVVLLGVAGLTLAGGIVLKVLVQRPRPDGSLLASPPPVDASFSYPSGHTTVVAVLVLTALALLGSRRSRFWVPVGAVLLVVVAASRVYLGAHYPLDVVAAVAYAVCAFTLVSALVSTALGQRLLSVVHLDAPAAHEGDRA